MQCRCGWAPKQRTKGSLYSSAAPSSPQLTAARQGQPVDTVEGPAVPVHPDHDALAVMALLVKERCSGRGSLLAEEGPPVRAKQHQALGSGVHPHWTRARMDATTGG